MEWGYVREVEWGYVREVREVHLKDRAPQAYTHVCRVAWAVEGWLPRAEWVVVTVLGVCQGWVQVVDMVWLGGGVG